MSILITGASSGIGAGLAEHYATPGVTLILTARNEQRLNEVRGRCEARGAKVITGSIDVRDKAAMADFITRMDEIAPIDLLIANAGISTGSFSGSETLEAAEAVFEVNVNGVIHSLHPILPRMVQRGRGQVAIMASLAGICALPGAPAYSASKAAVRYYGEALRGSLRGSGVSVSVICPGWIETPLTDKNDFPMPFLMPVSRAANIIAAQLVRQKLLIIFPKRLYFALYLLSILPARLRSFLLSHIPEKRQKT